VDVERRIPHRLTSGLELYTSLAANANGRHLAVTVASPKRTLWRLRIADAWPSCRENGHSCCWGERFNIRISGSSTWTNLTPDFDIHDFDISPGGCEVVLERVQERSDVVLLDLPRHSPPSTQRRVSGCRHGGRSYHPPWELTATVGTGDELPANREHHSFYPNIEKQKVT
jgi:hypothetical protein